MLCFLRVVSVRAPSPAAETVAGWKWVVCAAGLVAWELSAPASKLLPE